ncbi:MAG TPA: hypothetical protein VNV66_00625, partial [Pilimelia sp.]|nr:hypothetical protein [Pilimelia sp.]
SPTATPGWVRVGDGWGSPSYRRTFRLVGGTVTVVVSRGAVRVVEARPAPGFRFGGGVAGGSGEQHGGRLEFASPRHVSRLLVGWREGPYAEITESA